MAWTHYSDLIVWQRAMDLADEVYRLSRLLPREELFSLADQMRRAAVSVPSNIAEGHGRQTEKEFRQFLSVALGSVYELETQLQIGVRQTYFRETDVQEALSLCREISKMLTRLITASLPDAKN